MKKRKKFLIHLTPQFVFRACIILILAFLAAYVISFFVTETSYVPEYEYPQAYGRETLEYQSAPVIGFVVWQKNDCGYQSDKALIRANGEEYYHNGDNPMFYTRKSLILREGNTLRPSVRIKDGEPSPRLAFTVQYDGKFRGYTDIFMEEDLWYDPADEVVPGKWPIHNGPLYKNGKPSEDGTFSGKDALALSIYRISAEYPEYYTNQSPVEPREYFRDWVSQYETTEEFDFDRFFRMESFHDVYPDAPEIFADFERIVLTQRIYLEASHPYKPEIIVASGVVAVNTYSSWNDFFPTPEEEAAFELYEYERSGYREFEVESYQQSDWFSME